MNPVDIHPTRPSAGKALFRVRAGHSLRVGASRTLTSGTPVLVEPSWVRANAQHLLERVQPPEPKKVEPLEPEKVELAVSSEDGALTRAVSRSPRRG
jgi:hypothetical protein